MRVLPQLSKFKWIIFAVVSAVLLLAIIAVQFYQKSSTKSVNDIKNEATTSSEQTKPEEKSNPSSNPQTGTCTITKNGVTTVVPSDEVNVDEKSSGDLSVKVECKSSSSNSNGSNNSSVKTNIKVETNTD